MHDPSTLLAGDLRSRLFEFVIFLKRLNAGRLYGPSGRVFDMDLCPFSRSLELSRPIFLHVEKLFKVPFQI